MSEGLLSVLEIDPSTALFQFSSVVRFTIGGCMEPQKRTRLELKWPLEFGGYLRPPVFDEAGACSLSIW
jgi:hypothetical protein